jgi:hypothetical protein
MSKTWRKKTTIAVDWASKVRIYPTIKSIPNLTEFRESTALYWNVPIAQITPEMMRAHLRHNCTNYEDRITELAAINKKHRLSPNDRYVARNILKLSAIAAAERLFSKIIRRSETIDNCFVTE